MNTMLIRSFITRMAVITIVAVVAGCGWATYHPSNVWRLPSQVEANLVPGDTRQKVNQMLGEPQVYLKSYGIEIYQKSGRDWEVAYAHIFPLLPFPMPDQHVSMVVLVLYDQKDLIREINTELVSQLPEQCIKIGRVELAKSGGNELDTLFGPPITRNELSESAPSEGACSLVLLMGECPMGDVLLDDHGIVGLGDAPIFCPLHVKDRQLQYEPTSDYCDCGLPNKHYFYGTYIRRDVTAGSHRLTIKQRNDNFSTTLTCKPDETVYVELEAHRLSHNWTGGTTHIWGYGERFDGRVLTSKRLPKNLDDAQSLRPIIWHRGTWY